MAQQNNSTTELGGSISDLVGGPDECPYCGGVLRGEDKLPDDDEREAWGRSSGERAECIVVRCCGQRAVPTSEGVERIDLDQGWA